MWVQILFLPLDYWMSLERSANPSKPFCLYLLNRENSVCFLRLLHRTCDVTIRTKLSERAILCFLSSFLPPILSRQLKPSLKTSKSLSPMHVLIHINPSVGDMTCKNKICFRFGDYFSYCLTYLDRDKAWQNRFKISRVGKILLVFRERKLILIKYHSSALEIYIKKASIIIQIVSA